MRSPVRASIRAWLIASLAMFAPTAEAADVAGTDVIYFRAGGVSEGPQGTLKRGLEMGSGYERVFANGLVFGGGGNLARQGSQTGFRDFEARAFSLEIHGRLLMGHARVRPMAEMGVGYYWFRLDGQYSTGEPAFADRWNAPGAWFGLGAQAQIVQGMSARLGIAYHFIAQSTALEGGNAEDYFATGLTLAYGFPRR